MQIEFRNVGYEIDGRTIVRELSFRLNAGETLVLVGPSGAGKTTLLRFVNALRFPTTGEVLVGGKTARDWDPIALRRSTGYVLQEGGLFPHMTVAQNVSLVPRLLGWEEGRIAARVDALLEEVQLAPAAFGQRYPRQLSGGQRQRVGLARALAADPRILLFDEPFGALDPVTRLEMQRQFLALRERHPKTALFVTHDLPEALRLGTLVGLLYEGRLEALAPPAEFPRIDNPVVRAFLGTSAA